MDHEIRQFESNLSYVEGRAVELFVDKWLLDQGFVTVATRGSKNAYDLKLIDPNDFENGEFVVQIKSSKKHTPYITCRTLDWLLKDAKRMNCTPLICFCFTSKKRFFMFNPITLEVKFSNAKNLSNFGVENGYFTKFKCQDKLK